jgi:hypothetical protein
VEEKRRSPRKRALKGARIVLNKGNSTLSCTIRSLSEIGAMLDFATPSAVPDAFEIRFDDGTPPRRCVVKRRAGKSVAVTFVWT